MNNNFLPGTETKRKLTEQQQSFLDALAPRAAEKLVEILESEDPIPQVGAKLQAAQTLLDRVGIAKREKLDVTHTAAGGIFIIPEKRDVIDVNAEDVTPDDE